MTALPAQKRTTDYSKFVMHITNRVVSDESGWKPRKDLLESMKQYGFWQESPIICEKTAQGKLQIIDGHNRFVTAMSLGLPVDYIAYDRVTINPVEFSKNQKLWQISDYMSAYVHQDYEDYVEVEEYSKRTGISKNAAAAMFDNNLPTSGNTNKTLKRGAFKIKCRDYPEKVALIVSAINTYADWATSKSCLTAIARCVLTPEFDHHQMIQKIHKHSEHLKKQPGLDEYLRLLEVLYNKHNKSEYFPLAAKSASAIRERSKKFNAKADVAV